MPNLPNSCLDINLPDMKAECCVHTLITNASCRACVDSCHAKAWRLNEEQLGIDVALCDGCGICAAACPEDAITHSHHPPLSLFWQNERIALAACEKASNVRPGDTRSSMRCVHALGIRDLLRLYDAGHRWLLLNTANCNECNRGTGAILDKHLDQLNTLFKLRDEPEFQRINISATQWSDIIEAAEQDNAGERVSRRHFLRQATGKLGELGLQKFELHALVEDAQGSIEKLASIEPLRGRGPYFPEIDAGLCTVCNACVNLCPHDALTLYEAGEMAAYLVDAAHCTGCGVCVDVCEDSAITIFDSAIVSQTRIPLQNCTCEACGVLFHTLNSGSALNCRICQHRNHHAQLYQVLD